MLKLSTNSAGEAIKAETFYSLRMLATPSAGVQLARWLAGMSAVLVLFLFLPWQQNVRGHGTVTTLSPAHRPQAVQAVIAGQIQRWHVAEGQFVNAGDTIVTLREVKTDYFDPQLLVRLQEQLAAKRASLQAKKEKADALGRQIEALRVVMYRKIEQAEAKVEAEKVKFQNTRNQYERNKLLYEAGNIPLTRFQDIEYRYRGSAADYQNARVEVDRLKAESEEKMSKSESELSATRADIFETEGEISKLNNEYTNMRIRRGQYQVLAPQDGYVVRAVKAGIGETIKEGEAVCTVMPQANDLAVEMLVKARDIPLIAKGRTVRIEFDGWPALQFSGWPSVSVGTFGGRVEVIDYVSTEPGAFRILVTPDKEDEPWPSQLRAGSGTRGWVMLDSVPVWYEIWRQLNGFPPSLYEAPLQQSPAGEYGKPEKPR